MSIDPIAKMRDALTATRKRLLTFGGGLRSRLKRMTQGQGQGNGLRELPGRLFKGLAAKSGELFGNLKDAGASFFKHGSAERVWTLFLATVAVALGVFLVIAPAKELATGRNLGLEAAVSFCWLFTGLAMFAGGMGVVLRLPSFRQFLKVALGCSLPVAGAFVYRTATFALKMRSASASDQELLAPYVSAGMQLSAFFIGTSLFLLFLLYSRSLKRLRCSGGVLAGRFGWFIRAAVGATMGSGAGYVTWVVFRWCTDPANDLTKDLLKEIPGLDEAALLIPMRFFLAGGAAVGAIVAVAASSMRRRP